MVNASRVVASKQAYRRGHCLGNKILTYIVGFIFRREFGDILSGYRILSRRFVKSFPAHSSGFEVEVEMSVHALELRMPVAEISTAYKERPKGSISKLNTFRDGFCILNTIGKLIKEERPLQFFTIIFVILACISLILALPIFNTYLESGLVPRFPTAILATGLMLLAFLSLVCGLILDTVTLSRQELKRLRYLAIPGLKPTDHGWPK